MSNPKVPIITFTVNLTRPMSEKVNPVTNSNSTTAVLHPDRFQSDQDVAIASAAQHDALKSTWLPGFLAGENIVQNNDGSITAYGMKAVYLKDTYATGDNPVLTVVSITSESELP